MKTIKTYFRDFFMYKEMFKSLVKKGLRSRYKGSVLGFLWTFLNPLLQITVYGFVFSMLIRSDDPFFFLYVAIGLLPWIMFSSSIQLSTTCIVNNASLVNKVYFPRHILPISVVSVSMVNYLLTFIIIIPLIFILQHQISFNALLVIIPITILYLFAIGLGTILSALYVYFRDLEHIINVIMMSWIYLTPILYKMDFVFPSGSEEPSMMLKVLQFIVRVNPLTYVFDSIHALLFENQTPDWLGLLYPGLFAVVLFILSIYIFSHLQKTFAEEL